MKNTATRATETKDNLAPENHSGDDKRASVEQTLMSVAGGLAALFLQESLSKGKEMEIPSLKIKIKKSDLPAIDGTPQTPNNR